MKQNLDLKISDVKIRKANVKDIEEVLVLSDEMLKFHIDLDDYYGIYTKYEDHRKYYLEQLSKKDTIYFVAEYNKKLVAMASAYIISMPKTRAPKIGVLVSNFVKKNFRNHGIGKLLLEERIKWFKKNKVKFVEMNVDARNRNALNLWKRLGFKDYQIKLKKKI